MKKGRKTILTAAILSAAATGLAGCTNPVSDEVEIVYGPPPEADTSVSAEDTSSEDAESSILDKLESSEYDPSSEEVEDVYGPPPEFDDSYDPDDEPPECVYGPPEMLDSQAEEDDSFDPDAELITIMYGPPELMDGQE